MKQFKTIMKFEFLGYVRAKGYIITTAVLSAIILIAMFIPNIMGLFRSDDAEGDIGFHIPGITAPAADPDSRAVIADPAGIYTDEILAMYLPNFTFSRVSELIEPQIAVENEEYDLALWIYGLEFTAYERSRGLVFMGTTEQTIRQMIRDTNQRIMLEEHGLTAAEAYEVMFLNAMGHMYVVGTDYTQTFWVGYVMLFLIFFAVVMYGNFVSTSVVTEKSSKAMELLVTSAKPFQLIMGKVIGVGLAGLTQFVIVLAVAFIAFTANQTAWNEFAPMVSVILSIGLTAEIILLWVVFFILGFFSFALIMAGFASTISRMEDLNSIVLLPMLIFVVGFYVAIAGSLTPEMTYVRVTSFVPFLSPLVMFMRICVTTVPAWEILTAIVINIATIIFAGFVCSRIYRVGVMMYGKKPRFTEIMRYIVKG